MKQLLFFLAAMAMLATAPPVNSADLPPGLIVNGEATANLSWTIPTTRADGSALDPAEIAGFMVYWSDGGRYLADGTTYRDGCGPKAQPTMFSTSCYSNVLDLASGATTTHALSLMLDQDTTLCFTMATYDTDAAWSDFSNEVAKNFTVEIQINDPGAPVLQAVDFQITCTTNKSSVNCTFTVADPQ